MNLKSKSIIKYIYYFIISFTHFTLPVLTLLLLNFSLMWQMYFLIVYMDLHIILELIIYDLNFFDKMIVMFVFFSMYFVYLSYFLLFYLLIMLVLLIILKSLIYFHFLIFLLNQNYF
jgi:hypothetical protein